MKIEITLNKEHLKLIPFFYLQEVDDDIIGVNKNLMFNMGSHLMEDMAFILGYQDKALPNTENDVNGRAYDDETEKHMLEIFDYIYDNFYYIETLIHQYAVKGGISEGTYTALDNVLIWEKK